MNERKQTDCAILAKAVNLSPQCRQIVNHMLKAGSISAREAMLDLDIGGNALTRRIVDIEGSGLEVIRDRKKHPTTNKLYTRYSFR